MSGKGAAGVIAKAIHPAAHPAGPAFGCRSFGRHAQHRHMSCRNAPRHGGRGERHSSAMGFG